jgi:hypothetical protein
VSEHWLEHAHGRIVAGDDELEVLADYGWVQLTDEERAAILTAADLLIGSKPGSVLRKLLARLA